VNLSRIKTLTDAFGVPAGFSDHSWGSTAAIGSVVFGACFIEKHFTLDKNLPGPDHRFSSDPEEFRQLVHGVREIEKNIGSSVIAPTDSEKFGRKNFRLSLVARKDLPPGHVLAEEDIAFHRPSTGISPRMYDYLPGKRLLKEVKCGEQFTFENLLGN
jgi:N-acetylneuraminate synthase/N,N'-diacetyllegionaminate synthase